MSAFLKFGPWSRTFSFLRVNRSLCILWFALWHIMLIATMITSSTMILGIISAEKGFNTMTGFASGNWKINPALPEHMNSVQPLQRLWPAWGNQMQKGFSHSLAVFESIQQLFCGVRIKVCFVKDLLRTFEHEIFQSKVQVEKCNWGTLTDQGAVEVRAGRLTPRSGYWGTVTTWSDWWEQDSPKFCGKIFP